MKKILSTAFATAFFFVACHDHGIHAQTASPAKVAGKWQMTIDTPHGPVKGPFQVEQDGAKLSVTFEAEMFGKLSGTGSVDGKKVAFSLTVPNGPQAFPFSGTIDGDKMSGKTEMDGEWSAVREQSQSAGSKTVLGTVTDFKVNSLELGVQPDSGPTVWVKFSPETEVVAVAPGDHDLNHARPAKITDVARQDRVLASFVEGMPEARRIVLMPATAIERRDAAERLDWEKRGLSGVVAAREGGEITLENRTPQGAQHTIVAVTAKTAVRRYAPDSVKFADATPAALRDIAVGDQVRVRGDRSADGSRVTADDVVFGTFLTALGTVREVNRESHEIVILDSTSNKPLTVRLTADTRLKKMPDMHQMAAAHAPAGESAPVNIGQMLQQLPAGGIDDLKVGSSVVVTSTRGARPDRVTGIMVIANLDAFLQMAQSQAAGASPMEALNRLHGGMLGGPGGISLPAILQ